MSGAIWSARRMRRSLRSAAAAALLACLVTATAATPQIVGGSLQGLVADQTGAVLQGVSIVVHHPETGLERSTVTDDTGFFRMLLPVGVYDVAASLPGFSHVTRVQVQVTIGETTTLRLELALAAIAESISVSESSAGSGKRTTIGEDAVRRLPVNGRNFISFALLVPEVTRDVRTGDPSVGGQRSTLTGLLIDGVDNTNTFFGQPLGRGRSPYQFSPDSVQEFQINTAPLSAEYGRAAAVISVVTRSGTNAHHGSAFEFYRDKALNATNYINRLRDLPKSPYRYHQFGGTLGGPLRRNRDFFFTAYDGQRNSEANIVFLNLPSGAPADSPTLSAIERLRPLAQPWSRRLDQDLLFIRSDHRWRGGRGISARYNHQDFTGAGYEKGGPTVALENSGDSKVKSGTLSIVGSNEFSPRLFNEWRVQLARDWQPGTANSDQPEAAILHNGSALLTIGRNSFSPRENRIGRIQAADTLALTRATHLVKAGFDLQLDRIRNYFPQFFSGRYVFPSLAAFALGQPGSYRQHFAGEGTTGPRMRPDVREFSVFLQDEWRARPDVTLWAGLRYDIRKLSLPTSRSPDLAMAGIDTSRLEPDANNVGPRLGFTWRPARRTWLVRSGAGVTYGRTPAIAGAAAGNNGVNVIAYTVLPGGPMPTYPATLASPPVGVIPIRPSIFYIDPDLHEPRVVQANATLERAIRGGSVAVTYAHNSGGSLPRIVDGNLGPEGEIGYTVQGSGERIPYQWFGLPRRFPGLDRVLVYRSDGNSRYDALTFEVRKTIGEGSGLAVGYTLSRSTDTMPDAAAVAFDADPGRPSNPVDPEADRGPGTNDRPHRLVASGVYSTRHLAERLPAPFRAVATDWWFSAILTAESGRPYSATVRGADLNNDGNQLNDLVPGTGRNELRLPALVLIDARVSREVPLRKNLRAEVMVEGFNLANRRAVTSVFDTAYTLLPGTTTLLPDPRFGTPQSAASERILQLAVRLSF